MQVRSHELLQFVRYKLSLYVSLYSLLITFLSVPLSEGQTVITDGFNYPIGPRNPGYVTESLDNDGWYNAQDYGVENTDVRLNGLHAGEDWNDSCLDSSDVGAPVYAIANGEVVDFRVVIGASSGLSIGQVLVLKHTLPDGHPQGKNLYSLYLHIDVSVKLQKGDPVTRDQQIGTIADVTTLPPHLHFELRTKSIEDFQILWPGDTDDIRNNAYYDSIPDMDKDGLLNPSIFIDNNLPPSDALEPGRIPWSFNFVRDLERGMCRYEIRYLQILLNGDPATRVADSGPGSPDHETSNFGSLTEDAVKRFQEKFIGVSTGTGRVDAETRIALNDLLAGNISSACHTIEFSNPVPDGWGAPYSTQTSEHELLIRAECENDQAAITVGNSESSLLTYVWPTIHYWLDDQLKTTELTCAEQVNGWCRYSGQTTIDLNPDETWLVGYICQWDGTQWHCGCRDESCDPQIETGGLWQAQRIQR